MALCGGTGVNGSERQSPRNKHAPRTLSGVDAVKQQRKVVRHGARGQLRRLFHNHQPKAGDGDRHTGADGFISRRAAGTAVVTVVTICMWGCSGYSRCSGAGAGAGTSTGGCASFPTSFFAFGGHGGVDFDALHGSKRQIAVVQRHLQQTNSDVAALLAHHVRPFRHFCDDFEDGFLEAKGGQDVIERSRGKKGETAWTAWQHGQYEHMDSMNTWTAGQKGQRRKQTLVHRQQPYAGEFCGEFQPPQSAVVRR